MSQSLNVQNIPDNDKVLTDFTSAFKAFKSGELGITEHGYGSEQRDMDLLIRMSLAFGPGVVSTLREVGVFV